MTNSGGRLCSMVRLISLLLLVCLLPAGCGETAIGGRGWTFLFVMSYDNNLEPFGPVILDAIEEGVRETDTVATVLADFSDTAGLQRIVIDSSGREEEILPTDDSSSLDVIEDYVRWTIGNHPAKRYAIVFLNHGGGLDEMNLDRRTGRGSDPGWLSATEVGPMLARVRGEVDGEFELVFLQQCARGTIENLYCFRGAARAVLASQTRVGAPNTYYVGTIRWAAGNPDATGFDVADRVMWNDEDFTSYVCVNGDELANLPARLDPVIEEVLRNSGGAPRPPATAALSYQGAFRPDETTYDMLDWFEGLARMNGGKGSSTAGLSAFREWVENDLIVHHRKHPLHQRSIVKWTGLGLFVPEAETVRTRYAIHPFYSASRLPELWSALYPSAAAEGR